MRDRTVIAYKLFRKRKDGTYAPLFINRSQRLVAGPWYAMEDHPTYGYAHRPGWHACTAPVAPHLRQGGDRVWCKVQVVPFERILRPENQGGEWLLCSVLRIIGEL